ncbi:MAG: tRNA preQ1(34) S-adenosylmethionine ribosyltransferase-isomerase QueA [Candidatus Eiseniibacteriota bacterium]
MNASELDYELPERLIAQEPLASRSAARLLHLPRSGPPQHRRFAELPELLRPGDLVVLNETRVIPARVHLRRATGGAVEALLIRPEAGAWAALLKPANRLHAGERLAAANGASARLVEMRRGGEGVLEFEGVEPDEVPERLGVVPLPPYVRRPPRAEDRERYQTVFARVPGAVAAPTAGLHFDEAMLAALATAGVGVARLVLHVGPGTFRPLPDGPIDDHRLDPERFDVPEHTRELVGSTRARGGRVVAVGTTVVRALESAERGRERETDLFIRPSFEFRVVDCLVTNFHLPRSSLLCLVAALSGAERILAAYREAVRLEYRFYSYGDATFLERA